MAVFRPLGWLAAALLGALPALAAAEAVAPAPLAVAAGPDAVLLTLACPEPAPSLVVAVDRAPVAPLSRETLGATPPAVALVLDVSAPMGEPGTPHSTRLEDARLLADTLLAMAPPDAVVALVTAETQARVALPLTSERGAIRAALASLAAAPPSQEPYEPPLSRAIELGLGQLRGAPPGPRAVVAFVAGAPPHPSGMLSASAPLVAPEGSEARILIVGHSGAPADGGEQAQALAAAAPGAVYAPYHSAEIAALPALHRSLEGHFRRLLAPGERLRLELPPVGAGAHLLTVEGCGAPMAMAFAGQRPADWSAAAGVALVALGVGAAAVRWGRGGRRAMPGAAAPLASTEARLLAAAAITTARRAWGPLGSTGLRAVVWDGRRRRAIALEGRHWTIGCDPECAIQVEGEGVAPLHARLSAAGERLTLTDLEGGGGISVGALGRPLTPGVPEPLDEGELVLIGRTARLIIERAWAGPEEAAR